MEEPGCCSPWGLEELDMTERLHFHFSLSCIGEGNGNPLQRSCLENPRDGGGLCAVSGVAQSWTGLMRQQQQQQQCFLYTAKPAFLFSLVAITYLQQVLTYSGYQILSVTFVTNTFWFCGLCFTLCNFLTICLCISLAAQGLGCGTQAHCCSLWGLVPWPGMEPGPPALRTPSLSQWTPGECLECFLLILLI